MIIRSRLAEARAARARAALAHQRLAASTRGMREWPLVGVGVAASAGWALGRLGMRSPVTLRWMTAQLLPWVARALMPLRDPG